MRHTGRWLARLVVVVLGLIPGSALAEGADAMARGERASPIGGLCWVIVLVSVFRLGGVAWGRTLGAVFLPIVFAWGLVRDRDLWAPARWLALLGVLGQVFALGAVGWGAVMTTQERDELPKTLEERVARFRKSFLHRCSLRAPPETCDCVAEAAYDQRGRDDDDLKRLAFGLDQGALRLWYEQTTKRCSSPAAPAASAPEPATKTGEVLDALGLRLLCEVTTTPPGARLVVDGVAVATSPAKVEFKAGQRHVLRAEREGFFPAETSVERNANDTSSISLSLAPAARLRVTTTPPGASVRIGDLLVLAATPGETQPVPPGPTRVMVSAPGYRVVSEERVLSAGVTEVEYALVPGASVRVESTPRRATVLLDGQPVGVTPLDLVVKAGARQVMQVGKKGWSTVKKVLKATKTGERIHVTLVDLELAAAKSLVRSASTRNERAERELAKLQRELERTLDPSRKQERRLAQAEEAMEKAASSLEAAQLGLTLLTERRAREAAEVE